mmetsp:Transcript_52161/g.60921  ORF Transcript_52161/g.60921 Transcript_52161/m.60921 type:complete len:100 (-) Transcript_52161:125-424(-)
MRDVCGWNPLASTKQYSVRHRSLALLNLEHFVWKSIDATQRAPCWFISGYSTVSISPSRRVYPSQIVYHGQPAISAPLLKHHQKHGNVSIIETKKCVGF